MAIFFEQFSLPTSTSTLTSIYARMKAEIISGNFRYIQLFTNRMSSTCCFELTFLKNVIGICIIGHWFRCWDDRKKLLFLTNFQAWPRFAAAVNAQHFSWIPLLYVWCSNSFTMSNTIRFSMESYLGPIYLQNTLLKPCFKNTISI